ncbi:MAG: 6-phosphogluconolactonase [Planctomycetota bacterium]
MAEPYALEPEPAAPKLPGGDVVLRPTLEDLLDPAAADLFVHAQACVRAFGDFHLAMSIGEPQLTFALRLMVDPKFRWLPWKRTHLWLLTDTIGGTERGYDALAEIIGDHAGIPDSQLHMIGDNLPVESAAANAADAYERRLIEHLAWRERGQDRLDYALLAVDDAGDPDGYAPEQSEDQLVLPAMLRGAPAVTLTTRLLNATRLISVLATGPDRRGAVHKIASGEPGGFAGVKPIGGTLRWYVDAAANPLDQSDAGELAAMPDHVSTAQASLPNEKPNEQPNDQPSQRPDPPTQRRASTRPS